MRKSLWAWITLSVSIITIFGEGATPIFANGEIVRVSASEETDEPDSSLSTFWSDKVRRWEPIIIQEARRRELDPDFLASLVWMESRGDPTAVGPVGAVGLMQVMSREAGFEWRPTKAELMDPAVNLFWGTRTLSTVVEQGQGDIFNSLAAYNGGWDQIMYRGPTIFATTILRDYASAVVSREGVSGHWLGMFAVRNHSIHGPIWVVDSTREDVYLSRNENMLPDGTLLIPDIPPTAVVASCNDNETERSFEVGFWLYYPKTDEWVGSGVEGEADRFQKVESLIIDYPDVYFIALGDNNVGELRTRDPLRLDRSWRLAPVSLGIMPGARSASD